MFKNSFDGCGKQNQLVGLNFKNEYKKNKTKLKDIVYIYLF